MVGDSCVACRSIGFTLPLLLPSSFVWVYGLAARSRTLIKIRFPKPQAKLMHMTTAWGCRIPETPCDKGARAAHRAVSRGCTLYDSSYVPDSSPLPYMRSGSNALVVVWPCWPLDSY